VSDERLRRRIQSVAPPGELEAERRTWAVVRAAFGEREPARRPRRPRWAFVVPAVALAATAALAATPAGPAVVDAVRDVFRSDDARPGLRSLPASGRLLVSSDVGLWVVRRDGSKRRLGDYSAGSWSPNGKFVVGTDGRHVVALEPDTGEPRWSLTRRRVADARWIPGSGTRVAYRAGSSLRVVVGNGTDDRLLARDVARIPPAWRRGHEMQLAFADRRGVVRLVDVDTRRVFWLSRPGRVVALAWSADGARLASVSPGRVQVLTGGGRPAVAIAMPAGTRAVAAAYAPQGGRWRFSGVRTRLPRSSS
jgi:hypothetical protein